MSDVRGRNVYAHRAAYESAHGPIPDGFEVDHLCRVTLCCNPAHLQAVPADENWRRSHSPTRVNALKTHCPQGHEYSPENTRQRLRNGKAWRDCRQCERESYYANLEARRRKAREWQRKHKAEVRAATAPQV